MTASLRRAKQRHHDKRHNRNRQTKIRKRTSNKSVEDISIDKLQILERLKPDPLASKNSNAHVAVANISEEEKC